MFQKIESDSKDTLKLCLSLFEVFDRNLVGFPYAATGL